jgi:27-O-demethylrifamycin SV methyltransferase
MTSYAAADHYNRVTAAWSLLLGEELHYGVFDQGATELPEATRRLTQLMVEALAVAPGLTLLDVGCGTGSPACYLAARHGVRCTGITTSTEGIRAATERAEREGVAELTEFLPRDGMDNGFPADSFDRVWALESSHLMRRRERLIAECARVLKPGGRMALCDVILRRPVGLDEVRRRREDFALLRAVYGDARMEPLSAYRDLCVQSGLEPEQEIDLTEATRPTFAHWLDNADRHRDQVVEALGEDDYRQFVESCEILATFWDDGTLGYGLLSASKPA